MEWFIQGSDQIWAWLIGRRATAVAAVDIAPARQDPADTSEDTEAASA